MKRKTYNYLKEDITNIIPILRKSEYGITENSTLKRYNDGKLTEVFEWLQ